MLEESPLTCPYCGETISMMIDLSVDEQRYVEDCEVCCRPIEIHYGADDGALAYLEAHRGDD